MVRYAPSPYMRVTKRQPGPNMSVFVNIFGVKNAFVFADIWSCKTRKEGRPGGKR